MHLIDRERREFTNIIMGRNSESRTRYQVAMGAVFLLLFFVITMLTFSNRDDRQTSPLVPSHNTPKQTMHTRSECLCTDDCPPSELPCISTICNNITGACESHAMTGCCTADADCSDGNPCTSPHCDTVTNTCTSSMIAGCCRNHTNCYDGLLSTNDTCNTTTHQCEYIPIVGYCTNDSDCPVRNHTQEMCLGNRCYQMTGVCHNDSQCLWKQFTTYPYKRATCINGTCVLGSQTFSCITNSDCNDGSESTFDECNFSGNCDFHSVTTGATFTAISGNGYATKWCLSDEMCVAENWNGPFFPPVSGCGGCCLRWECSSLFYMCLPAVIPRCCSPLENGQTCTRLEVGGINPVDSKNCRIYQCVSNNTAYGTCILEQQPGCCVDSDCDDGNIYTNDTCLSTTKLCSNQLYPGQCLSSSFCPSSACQDAICSNKSCIYSTLCCDITTIVSSSSPMESSSLITSSPMESSSVVSPSMVESSHVESSPVASSQVESSPVISSSPQSELPTTLGSSDERCSCTSDCHPSGYICNATICNNVTHLCEYRNKTGCCASDVDCKTTNVCTQSHCLLPAGVCQHAKIAECCVADSNCHDGSPCTTNKCNTTSHRCIYPPIAGCCLSNANCSIHNHTIEQCKGAACHRTIGYCHNNSQCLWKQFTVFPYRRAVCNHSDCMLVAQTFSCTVNSDCDDGDPDTIDTCIGSLCQFRHVVTNIAFVSNSVEQYATDWCIDDEMCVALNWHTPPPPIPSCVGCCRRWICGNTLQCSSQSMAKCCKISEIGHECTDDEVGGFSHDRSGNECWFYVCTDVGAPDYGRCVFTKVRQCCVDSDCDDGNPVSVDTCLEQHTCLHVAVPLVTGTCRDRNDCPSKTCYDRYCINATCVYSSSCCSISSSPSSVLSSSSSVLSSSSFIPTTISEESEGMCYDGDACTQDLGTPDNGCNFTVPVVCPPFYDISGEINRCYRPICTNITGCTHLHTICNTTNEETGVCKHVYCVPSTGECIEDRVSCDDGDNCTIDVCVNGTCVHQPVECIGTACNPAWCDVGGICHHNPRGCDDANKCTIDTCEENTGNCSHNESISCGNPAWPCLDCQCVPSTGECVCQPKHCDDENPDTFDVCNEYFGCIHNSRRCPQFPCFLSTYHHRWGCTFSPLGCQSGQYCRRSIRGESECVEIGPREEPRSPFSVIDPTDLGNDNTYGETEYDTTPQYAWNNPCDDNDGCTEDIYVAGGCMYMMRDCSDGNTCTHDVCLSGSCIRIPLVCDGESEWCDATFGECVNGTRPEFVGNTGSTVDTHRLVFLWGLFVEVIVLFVWYQ